MTSSFVKVMFSLIRKVPVFFPVVENVLNQMHIQFAAMIRMLECIFTKKQYFTG